MSMSSRRPLSVSPTIAEIENDNQHQSNSRGVVYTAAAAFFGMFITTRSMPLFMSQLASKVILPLAAVGSVVNLFYKWQEHQKKKQINGETNGFASLMVDAAVAVGVVASVITAFVTTAAIAPIIAVASLALKSAWELAMAAKDFYQAFNMPVSGADATNGRKAELYRNAAIHLGQAVVTGLIGLSLGLMAWSGLAAFTYLGLAAAGSGVALEALTKNENSHLAQVSLTSPKHVDENASTADIALRLGHGFEHVNTLVKRQFYSDDVVYNAVATPTPAATVTKRGGLVEHDSPVNTAPANNKDYTVTLPTMRR